MLQSLQGKFFQVKTYYRIEWVFLKEIILAVIGRDPNDQMFPIAYVVVEGETKDS